MGEAFEGLLGHTCGSGEETSVFCYPEGGPKTLKMKPGHGRVFKFSDGTMSEKKFWACVACINMLQKADLPKFLDFEKKLRNKIVTCRDALKVVEGAEKRCAVCDPLTTEGSCEGRRAELRRLCPTPENLKCFSRTGMGISCTK